MFNYSISSNYFLYISFSFHPILLIKIALKMYTIFTTGSCERIDLTGIQSRWRHGAPLNGSGRIKRFQEEWWSFEICSLANWLIISMWWLNAFLLLYSQGMHKLLYSRISHFLSHRNITGRQHANVKIKFLLRREMFMDSMQVEVSTEK